MVLGKMLDLPDPLKVDNRWIYQREMLGLLSLGSVDQMIEAQRQKLRSFPKDVGPSILACEGLWYLSAYHDILASGYQVPQDRLHAMLAAGRASCEVLLENDPNNLAALQGLAAYYSEAGDPQNAVGTLQRLVTQAMAAGDHRISIQAGVALARATRESGRAEDAQAAPAIFDEALKQPMGDAVRDQIRAERNAERNQITNQGVGLFNVSGLSFNSLVSSCGVLSRLVPEKRQELLTALSAPFPASYDPQWTLPMSQVMDPVQSSQLILETAGFSSDTLVRLYYATTKLQLRERDPIALAGLAQSLQETDQLDLANEYFEEALAVVTRPDIGMKNTGATRRLTAYIRLRQGFSAVAAQQPQEAKRLWMAAKDSDDKGEISNMVDGLLKSRR
jgi:tetratricopeptide (TPR) repeat protein